MPTRDAVEHVLPELERSWSENALLTQQRIQQALERNDHNAAKAFAITGGVCTDKILAIKNGPAAPAIHLHAHRYELGGLMDRLAVAAKALPSARIVDMTPALTKAEAGWDA